MYFKEHPDEFFTATNLIWLHLLANDYHKQILIEALKHRTDNGQLTINAFVIMPNHFHIIWRIHNGIERGAFQRDLMKFTARSLLKFMLMNDDALLPQLKVKAADRQQQVWERNLLSVELVTEKISPPLLVADQQYILVFPTDSPIVYILSEITSKQLNNFI